MSRFQQLGPSWAVPPIRLQCTGIYAWGPLFTDAEMCTQALKELEFRDCAKRCNTWPREPISICRGEYKFLSAAKLG